MISFRAGGLERKVETWRKQNASSPGTILHSVKKARMTQSGSNICIEPEQGTLDYGITYTRGGDSTLVGFCDSDWAGDIDGRRSVIGYCFSLGSGVISWISKKQPTIALSSTEAEYKAACFASCEALWLRRLLGDMGAIQEQPTMLLCDNQSCMAIARNPVFHAHTKHIEVQYHFVRELILDGEVEMELILDGEVEMEYCPTMDN
ncbi:hypothetical protein L7F22_065324 [Adiantum nelumboides]|nr:hypothetical protein [Adiantum nelumboides]